ncbi:MAG: AAA family ATPase [Patescibacteria group bacterium]|nr:AAA family ATPase [Patescibacteria group bacterium]
MSKLILGFVGQAGAGKNTAAKLIGEKHSIEIFVFSDILKDLLKRLYLPASRENLIAMSQATRQFFGQDVLSIAMDKQVSESPTDVVIVDGIRRVGDLAYLDQNPNFHLIEIWAPPEVRFQRLKNRNEKPGESDMTWEDFLEMSKKETEMTIAGVAEKAEAKIENDGDLATLSTRLEALFAKLNY